MHDEAPCAFTTLCTSVVFQGKPFAHTFHEANFVTINQYNRQATLVAHEQRAQVY